MAIRLISVLSKDAPTANNSLWIKPVEGGLAIYAKFNGKWQPLKMGDDGGTAPINDDEVPELATVGDYESAEATDDTIAGAKKYADGIGEALTGTSDDTYEDLTLNGLKKYIDKQINDLE